MEPIRILVVEDDQDINRLLCTILNDAGYFSQSAFSGSEAMLWAEKEGFDLVLLDLMLPEEDGLHILKRIRAGASTARLPVILITAKGTEYDKVVGLDGGADDYIAKPFGMMELMSRTAPQRRGGGAGPRPYFGPTAHRSGPPSGAGPRAGSHPHPEGIPAALPFGGACGDRIYPGPAAQHHLGL